MEHIKRETPLRFHVNPNTGMPSRCTAKPGNCPYGGEGVHFSTYSEAFEVSQDNMSESYGILRNLNETDHEIQDMLAEIDSEQRIFKQNFTEKLNNEDLRPIEIYQIEDPQTLLGIIDGTLDKRRSWMTITYALRNPNLPKEYVEEIIYNSEKYNPNLVRRILHNPQVTQKDLMYLLGKIDKNDLDTRSVIYMHPEFDNNIVLDNINNNVKIREVPYEAMLFGNLFRKNEEVTKKIMDMLGETGEISYSYEFKESKAYYKKYVAGELR